MKRRYKKYCFDDNHLYFDGLDAEDFALFFKRLPEDSKIIRWGQEINRAVSFFIVEHESFEEINEAISIPEVIFNFDDEWLKEQQTINFSNRTQVVFDEATNLYDSYGTLFNKSQVEHYKDVMIYGKSEALVNLVQTVNQTTVIPSASRNLSADIISKYINNGLISSETAEKLLANEYTKEINYEFKESCQHSWKTYNGLMYNYDYCEKCDEKRTVE